MESSLVLDAHRENLAGLHGLAKSAMPCSPARISQHIEPVTGVLTITAADLTHKHVRQLMNSRQKSAIVCDGWCMPHDATCMTADQVAAVAQLLGEQPTPAPPAPCTA